MTTTAVIRHRVRDFDAWRKVYDEFQDVQARLGVRWHAVWRAQHDRRLVTVIHVFDSPEAMRRFLDAPELKDAMTRGGVELETLRAEAYDEIEAGAIVSEEEV
jgi:heme-degrading monooxygenase HmoA